MMHRHIVYTVHSETGRPGGTTTAVCTKAPPSDRWLDRAKPSRMNGILEMPRARLCPAWGTLAEALRPGQPYNESKTVDDGNASDVLDDDPERLRGYLQGRAMPGRFTTAAEVVIVGASAGETGRASVTGPIRLAEARRCRRNGR